jgi:putative flippase GtrA
MNGWRAFLLCSKLEDYFVLELLWQLWLHLLSKQFWLFVLTSGFAAVLHWLSRYLLTFIMPYTIALIVAYAIGMATAYALSALFVFKQTNRPVSEQIKYFIIINLVAFPFVWCAAYVLSEFFFPHIGLLYHPREIAHAIAICLPVLANYFAHKYITFKDLSGYPH